MILYMWNHDLLRISFSLYQKRNFLLDSFSLWNYSANQIKGNKFLNNSKHNVKTLNMNECESLKEWHSNYNYYCYYYDGPCKGYRWYYYLINSIVLSLLWSLFMFLWILLNNITWRIRMKIRHFCLFYFVLAIFFNL